MNIVQFVKSYLPGIIKEMEDAKFNIETHSEIFKMLLFVKQAIRNSGILTCSKRNLINIGAPCN